MEHQIIRFAKMILRDKCSTLYDLASSFRGRRSTWSRKIGNALVRGRQLNFPFLKEISQKCFVFEGVNFEKLRKSFRIASFFDAVNFDVENCGRLAGLLRF